MHCQEIGADSDRTQMLEEIDFKIIMIKMIKVLRRNLIMGIAKELMNIFMTDIMN